MKNVLLKTIISLTLIFTITLISCDENTTIGVPGPDIEFVFNYSDLQIRSANTSNYILVAQTDTIQGKDVETFISANGTDYSSVIEAATIYNSYLKLNDNHTFAGVDSVQIRYQIEGSNEEITLSQCGVNDPNSDSLSFSNININKAQAFELIKNNIVAKLYAIYSPEKVNCFQPGVVYTFKANTTLKVKSSAITDGVKTE
jgi:hypothetical protein